MKFSKWIAVASVLATGVGGAAQAQTFLTSSGSPSLAGAALVDFSAVASGSYATLTTGNVSFSGNGTVFVENTYGGLYNSSGKYLTNNVSGFTELLIDFAAPVSAFGFNWGASNEDWTLSAYDSASNLIASYSVPMTEFSNAGDFFGIAASDISYARLTQATFEDGPVDYSLFDNLQYTTDQVSNVPELATWTMMLLGFSAVGFSMRRRRSARRLNAAA